MSIVAALDKVLFFNASSKYSVLRMKTEDSSVPAEARSPYRYHDHLIRFTAVGIELPQTDTVKIEMDGEWKDGKYGLQLQVDHWQEIVPPTLEGVRNYLASGLLKGIGEKTADAIIEKFGVNALEILEHQPDRLLEIRGITKERLAEIKDAYPAGRGSRSAAASSRRRNIGSPNRKHRSTPQGSCRKSVKVANLPCSPPNRLCAPPPPMRLRPEHTLPEKQPCRWPCGNRRQKRQKPRCRKPHRRQAVRCALSLPLPRAYLQQ